MTSTIRLALGMLLAAVSCGETDAPPAAGDAGDPKDVRGDGATNEDIRRDGEPLPSRRWVEFADVSSDCFPRQLPVDIDDRAACVLFVALPQGTTCDSNRGFSAPDPRLLQMFITYGSPSNLGTSAICEAIQLGRVDFVDGDCVAATKPGWCLVLRSDAEMCKQGIHLSPTLAITPDTRRFLGCLNESFSDR